MLVTGTTDGTIDLENRSRWSRNAFGAFFNSNLPKQDDADRFDSFDRFDNPDTGIPMSYATLPPEQDPSLIQAARTIYETYYTVHPEVTDLPLGVAIDRTSYRGKLIFKQKPALLPKECFIPFSSIDAR
jgi:hypothetical protein